MRCSNSIKLNGWNYQFARDGGAVGVINVGVFVLANRMYIDIPLFTVTGLTGGLLTTISIGTISDPMKILASEPIASFAPFAGVALNIVFQAASEQIIMTIENQPVTSGNFVVPGMYFEMQGL